MRDCIRSAPCRGCGANTLLAPDAPPLEPNPVLPKGECGECEGKGIIYFHEPVVTAPGSYKVGDLHNRHKATPSRSTCPACKGTGQSGENPTRSMFALNTLSGEAHPFRSRRDDWTTLHRRHRCAAGAAT